MSLTPSKRKTKENRSDWVAVDSEFPNTQASGSKIEKAKSAFQFYQKEKMTTIRQELQEQKKQEHLQKINEQAQQDSVLPASLDNITLELGVVQKELAARWKALDEKSRQVYLDLAAKDKGRYLEECQQRDQEVELEREKKRQEREGAVEGKRERKPTAHAAQPRPVRKERVLTEEQQEAKRLREEVRSQQKELRDELKQNEAQQKSELAARKAAAASARLQFLLTQSDIFEHFGQHIKDRKEMLKKSKGDAVSSPRKRLSEHEEDDAMMHEEHDTVRLTQQPSCIKFGTMRDYQLEGLNWLINLAKRGVNGILADEMGLGKTLQTISILAYYLEYEDVQGPHIVLVPKSTLSNWLAEFNRWCPSLRAVKFHGNKEERDYCIENVLCPGVADSERKFDVCITTFEMAIREKGALGKFAWRYLVIDEAHRIKNETSQFSQVVRTFATEHRILLTGTPLQNNLHELWALLNFLLPDVFASAEEFDDWFNLDTADDEAKKKVITQLHRLLRPFMLRRLKSDVETTLKPKKETLLFVGMSKMQKLLYKKLLLRDMESVTGGSSSRTALLNIMMQLRKCCGHPYLFEGQEDRTLDAMGEHVIENCGKLVLLDKLLKKLEERGSRVLIFSQMTRVLDILEDYMRMRNYDYCRIDGQTSYDDRENAIDVFNQPNSPKFAFLLSTRAGGLGINLYTADTVILYDSDWNPQADLQAQDRAHRIGQKKQVNVYRLITSNSVEEKIVERAQKKLKLDAMVVQQGRLQEKSKKQLSKNEMLDMIRFGADQVFRAQDSEITDADIDAILAEGEARTAEMNEKLQKHDKGDLLDFKLDGGASIQTHDGIDYSKEKSRQDELKRMAEAELALAMSEGMGKRERKPVRDYNVNNFYRSGDYDRSKRRKHLPKALRLPRMDEWQFYNRQRIIEIHEIECAEYERAKAAEETITEYLPEELKQEKEVLLSEGFPEWNKQVYFAFVRLVARHGRKNLAAVARDMERDEAEVRRYSEAFWVKGPHVFSDWDKLLKNIEKGESKLLEIEKLTEHTAIKVGRYANPWEDMTILYQGKQGRVYTVEEDRYLLSLAHRHGYGAWEKVKHDICNADRFLFDYYLRSRTAQEIGRRCDFLMRLCEKDNADYEVKEKRDIKIKTKLEEERKVLNERIQAVRQELERHQSKVKNAMNKEVSKMQELKLFKREWTHRLQDEKQLVQQGNLYRDTAVECFVGPLLRFVVRSMKTESNRLALAFCREYSKLPVQAVLRKIKEVAEYGKKNEFGGRWHIKQAFVCRKDEPEQVPSPSQKRRPGSSSSTARTPPAKKRKSANSTGQRRRGPASPSSKKRRTKKENAAKSGSEEPKKPKKARSAFVLFSLAKRSEVKASLPDCSISNLMDELTNMWKGLSEEERAPYLVQEKEDKERCEHEYANYRMEIAKLAETKDAEPQS